MNEQGQVNVLYADPILQLLGDLKTVYNNATAEVAKLREMLNKQNEEMIKMQQEIDNLKAHGVSEMNQAIPMPGVDFGKFSKIGG